MWLGIYGYEYFVKKEVSLIELFMQHISIGSCEELHS